MANLRENLQFIFPLLIFLSGLLLTSATYSLFEYVCDEKMLFEPYLHVYEHRKGKRILDRGVGFHTLDHMSNIYVCINGPAYLFYSRTTELGLVYEAPQSGVFAHICEMHNVVPHWNASRKDYVLHLMAVLVYGDKKDYRKPSVQHFTAPYYFEENEYSAGFPEHYQNATSVAVIGNGTCTIKKEGPTPNTPPVLINIMSVWPPTPAPKPTDPAPDPEAEVDNYVCKQGFSELQTLAKAFKPASPPALPTLSNPDTSEPEPTVAATLKYGDALEKMKAFVNDWPITYTECLSDVFDAASYQNQLDHLLRKMEDLVKKMTTGHPLDTIKKLYGDKIFKARKSLEDQQKKLNDKLTDLKSNPKYSSTSPESVKLEEAIKNIEETIKKEREKYYTFAVNLKFGIDVFVGLKLTDSSGKALTVDTTKPPEQVGGVAVNWDSLKTAAETAAKQLKEAEDKITAIESEVLINIRELKETKLAKKKVLEEPTTGVYATTKALHDAIANWKLELSKAEVWYSIIINEFDKHKKEPIVNPDKSNSKKKGKGRKLTYSRSTIPQLLYIVGEGATDPGKVKRKRRDIDAFYSTKFYHSKMSNVSSFEEDYIGMDGFDSENYEFNGDPLLANSNDPSNNEYDVDFGGEVERPKRLIVNQMAVLEGNDVPDSLVSQDDFEMDVEPKNQEKRQSPVSLLPKCELLPKVGGLNGECRSGKPETDVACELVTRATGHKESFPDDDERPDHWKKRILQVIGDVFIQACPNFYHRKHFVKKLINAFSYYLTSDKHFGQPPAIGVSQSCRAFRAWEENTTHPVIPEIKPIDVSTKERETFWNEIYLLITACKDARKSLNFVSRDKSDDEVEWKFVSARDQREIDVNTYSEQAEKEYIFNWVIDMVWKMFGTAHGICMGGYEVNNALISSRFYHMFSEDFLIPLAETWVNPRDNLIFQWVFSEFYYGDAEEWMERCMNAGYMFSERDSYRTMRPLLVNCRSEYNYLTNINAPYLNDLYYSDGKKIF